MLRFVGSQLDQPAPLIIPLIKISYLKDLAASGYVSSANAGEIQDIFNEGQRIKKNLTEGISVSSSAGTSGHIKNLELEMESTRELHSRLQSLLNRIHSSE